MKRLGLISDTHGLLRPEARAALRGCDRIIHAGDIGNRVVLDELMRIAPVDVVRGNNDRDDWARQIPEEIWLTIEGVTIHVLHDLAQLRMTPSRSAQVIIAGHSHKPRIDQRAGVLYVNPGSAGPRRFRLPVTVAYLDISGVEAQASIIELELAPSTPRERTSRARNAVRQ